MFSYKTRQPIFVFSPDDSGGRNPDGNNDEGNDPPHSEGNAGDEKKRQAELDRQFAERAKRAAEAERKQLWEALGVKTQEEFDAYVKAKKEAEDAQKTALQKAQDEAKQEKDRADQLEANHKTETDALRKRIQDSEIKMAASMAVMDKEGKVKRGKFRADALDDVLLLIDRSKIVEGEDGKYEGIEDAVATLAKTKPWMLEEESQPPTKGKKTPDPKSFKSGGSKIKSQEEQDDEPFFRSL